MKLAISLGIHYICFIILYIWLGQNREKLKGQQPPGQDGQGVKCGFIPGEKQPHFQGQNHNLICKSKIKT